MDCVETEEKKQKMEANLALEEFRLKTQETNALITHQYKDLVDQISEQHFVPLEQLVHSLNKKINTEKFIETFRIKLFEKISSQFDISWTQFGIGDALTLLEYSKDQSFKKGDETKWRPCGQTVDSQVRPISINALLRKKHFYEKQLRFQAEKLQEMVLAVGESRKYIQDLKERQTNILQKIDKDQQQMIIAEKQLEKCRNNLLQKNKTQI